MVSRRGPLMAMALILGLGIIVAGFRSPADAAANTTIKVTAASIDGHSLFADTRANPVPLEPRPDVPFSVTVENEGGEPVEIRYVRITGAMLGIRFVRYQASVQQTVRPGGTVTISQPADFFDIDGRANGYINSALQVVDGDRNTLASKGFSADVQGKFLSSEGIMLVLILVFFAIGLIQIILGVSQRRLARNRFYRGILFATTFISAALAVVIGIAMLRIGLLRPTTWVPSVLLTAAAGFVLGYLSPGPLDRKAEDTSDDKVIDLVAAEAVARASGQHDRRTTGGSVPAHDSGAHAAHESGEFSAQQQSGGFAPQHDSGSVEPQQ